MPLPQETVGRMLMVGFAGFEPPPHILQWLAEGRVGGLILFARNVASPSQLAELTQACHEAAPYPILIAIDQEGGIVARLREGFTEAPGAMALGATGSEQLAEQVAGVLGAEMRAVGINWNFAPVLDLAHPSNIHNPSVGVRAYGDAPELVARLGAAQVRGFQSAGVAATAKHFPGKVQSPVDPHVDLPSVETPLEDMRTTDLVPYRAAIQAGLAAVMIAHVQFRALDPEHPSTLSHRVISGLLRQELGFGGVVVTDCMEMGAITRRYSSAQSALLAAQAGADVILISHTRERQEEAYRALVEAVNEGRLPAETVQAAVERVRTLAERYAVTEPPALDRVHTPEHRAITLRAARAGLVQLRAEDDVLPLRADDARAVALIEFASHLDSDVLESGGQSGLAALLGARLPRLQSVLLPSRAPDEEALARADTLAERADVLIVATRNAHLSPPQQELAARWLAQAQHGVLLCLRNPYDAGALEAGTVLCTLGDGAPSLQAAVDALLGEFQPSGKLPVAFG